MKAFEKIYPKPLDESDYHIAAWNDRRRVWKAALECILDKCHHYQNQDVIDFIQEELEQ